MDYSSSVTVLFHLPTHSGGVMVCVFIKQTRAGLHPITIMNMPTASNVGIMEFIARKLYCYQIEVGKYRGDFALLWS